MRESEENGWQAVVDFFDEFTDDCKKLASELGECWEDFKADMAADNAGDDDDGDAEDDE